MKEGKMERSKGERETKGKIERPNIALPIWDPRFRNLAGGRLSSCGF